LNWHALPAAEQYFVRRKLEKHIRSKIPDFEIKDKKKSPLMEVLGWLLFFNKRFLDNYVTTIYPKVYVPEVPYKPYNHLHAIGVLAHEYVHLSDRKKLGWLFNFIYLSPQILAVIGLLGFFISPWYFIFLLFILPMPSPGRTWAEVRGYRMSMAIQYWLNPEIKMELLIDRYVYQFTSSSYYWMMPFKDLVRGIFIKELDKIRTNELSSELEEIKLLLGV
jgi:hypothetical protein